MSEEYLINSNHVQAQNLNNENNSLNIDFPHLSAIAAVAVIVASKIHEVKSFNAVNIYIYLLIYVKFNFYLFICSQIFLHFIRNLFLNMNVIC